MRDDEKKNGWEASVRGCWKEEKYIDAKGKKGVGGRIRWKGVIGLHVGGYGEGQEKIKGAGGGRVTSSQGCEEKGWGVGGV